MPMKPVKLCGFITLMLLLCILLCGCWNYRQLNQISIVVGMSVDKAANDDYLLHFELIDLSQPGDKAKGQSFLVESTGKTIFEAARNTKTKVADKLYFGNMEILVISNQIVKEDGIMSILDWFSRDAEPRETMKILISQEETAWEILNTKGLSNGLVSIDLKEIVESDPETTASTINREAYDVYRNIKSQGLNLLLPAVHCVENKQNSVTKDEITKKIAAANGIAIFKGDKFLGYLSPKETFYTLFVLDEIQGGVISMAMNNSLKPNIGLEISTSKTKKSYKYENGKITAKLDIETSVYLDEVDTKIDVENPEIIKKIEQEAAKTLTKNIKNTIKKVQTQFNSDIFGFGNTIYKKDYKLWEELKPNWDQIFPTVEVEINAKIHIRNTAFIKKAN